MFRYRSVETEVAGLIHGPDKYGPVVKRNELLLRRLPNPHLELRTDERSINSVFGAFVKTILFTVFPEICPFSLPYLLAAFSNQMFMFRQRCALSISKLIPFHIVIFVFFLFKHRGRSRIPSTYLGAALRLTLRFVGY